MDREDFGSDYGDGGCSEGWDDGFEPQYDGDDGADPEDDEEENDDMDGDAESALASAGLGTDEDYGDFGGDDE